MILLFSLALTLLVTALAYRVANRRLQYRHRSLQIEVLVSSALSTLFGRLLTLGEFHDAGLTTTLLRLAGFVAMFNMLVAASRLVRALRADARRGLR